MKIQTTLEELGVDRLFVDEAHSYKNLFLYTKMQNVAGLSTSDAQKSSDMFAKCRYMDELTGSRGVIFATGTPVSNSMTELYTMQRHLFQSLHNPRNNFFSRLRSLPTVGIHDLCTTGNKCLDVQCFQPFQRYVIQQLHEFRF